MNWLPVESSWEGAARSAARGTGEVGQGVIGDQGPRTRGRPRDRRRIRKAGGVGRCHAQASWASEASSARPAARGQQRGASSARPAARGQQRGEPASSARPAAQGAQQRAGQQRGASSARPAARGQQRGASSAGPAARGQQRGAATRSRDDLRQKRRACRRDAASGPGADAVGAPCRRTTYANRLASKVSGATTSEAWISGGGATRCSADPDCKMRRPPLGGSGGRLAGPARGGGVGPGGHGLKPATPVCTPAGISRNIWCPTGPPDGPLTPNFNGSS